VDNTNGPVKTREKFITIARDNKAKVIVIHFTTPKNIVLHLNALRTKIMNRDILNKKIDEGHSVPAVAIHSYWKRFEKIDKTEEKIDYLFEMEYEPVFNKVDGISKEQFMLYI
jgi:predicted kinase